MPLFSNDGNVLFNESIGSSYETKDHMVYDSDSGKWYISVFEIEQAFWASKFYYFGGSISAPRVAELPEFEFNFDPCFKISQVPLVGIDIHYQMKYNIKTLDDLYLFNNT